LPVKSGFYSIDANDAFTRFGPVSGNAFGSPDQSFYYFNLREANAANNPASLFGGVAYSGPFPTSGIVVHDLFPGFPGKSLIPMLPVNYGGKFGGAPKALLYSAYSANLTTFPNDDRAVALYAVIAIDGVGAGQKSAVSAYTGVYIGDTGSNQNIYLTGYSRGSVRLSSSGTPIRVSGGGGTTSRDDLGRSMFGLGDPNHFVISSEFTESSGTLFNAAGFVQTLENTSVPAQVFFHESYSRPAPLPSGVGTSRTSQTLKGYGAGIVTTKVSGTISTYVATTYNDTPENFAITTNPANKQATAVFKTQDALGSQSAMLVYFGNPSGNSRARQAFIDDNIFGIRESTSLTDTIGGAASNGRIALVTSAFTSLSGALTSGVSFCTCRRSAQG